MGSVYDPWRGSTRQRGILGEEYTLIPVICLFFTLFLLPAEQIQPQELRSFNDIFGNLPPAVREAAFSDTGYTKSTSKQFQNIYAMESAIDPQIFNTVFSKQPGFLVESIMVIPGADGKYSILNIYNALGKVRELKGRLYHSHTRNENVPLFEDVTRIESARRNTPIADPAPAVRVPPSETIYMRLKDVNFGNSYYRGDMSLVQRGLRYSLANNRSLTYFFVPVIKEEKFTAQFYFEPITEGILIYALAGADVSDFVSSKIDMPSAISKRLAVIIDWVVAGIIAK